MIYLATEDSGSGNEFWKLLFLAYGIKRYRDLRVVMKKEKAVGGIEALRALMIEVLDEQSVENSKIKLNKSDILIVSYDELGPLTIKTDINKHCIQLRNYCKVFVCNYQSTEWLIIRCKELWGWLNAGPYAKSYAELYTGVAKFILGIDNENLIQSGFWRRNISDCSVVMQPIYRHIATLEKNELGSRSDLSSAQRKYLNSLVADSNKNPCRTAEDAISKILELLTDETGFWFVKSIIGPCWKVDCCNQGRWDIETGKIILNDGKERRGITKHIIKRCNNVEPKKWKERLMLLAKDSNVGRCVQDMKGNHYTIHEMLELLATT